MNVCLNKTFDLISTISAKEHRQVALNAIICHTGFVFEIIASFSWCLSMLSTQAYKKHIFAGKQYANWMMLHGSVITHVPAQPLQN